MPQAVGIGAAVATAVGATGALATAITVAVNLGVTYATSQLIRSVFGPSRGKPSDGQQNIRVAVGSRKAHYGIVHTGGQYTFHHSKDGTLGMVITLGTREEAEILEHRLHDVPVTVTGGTVQGESYRGAIHIYSRPGTSDQTAIGELTAKFPEWTSNHRQRGCPHVAIICDPVKQKHFAEVYNNQQPEYTQVRKAAKLYDPRLDSTMEIGTDENGDPIMGSGSHRIDDPSTWEWSDNGPLVMADYWAHPDGYGGGYENVNWACIAREADFADITRLTVSGETVKQWRIWGSYSLAADERRQVLADMATAIDAFYWEDTDCKFNLICGRWEEPDVVITDDHILRMSATRGQGGPKRVSAVKVLYTEAAIGYREQEAALVAVPGAEDDPNADVHAPEVFFAPHHFQASVIGKLIARRLGDRWRLTGELNLFGLNLLGQRFCRVESQLLGVSGWFLIGRVKLVPFEDDPDQNMRIGVELEEVDPTDWDPEEGTPPRMPGITPATPGVAVPTGLALSAEPIALGETGGVAIAATWDDPGRPDLTWELQHRPTSGGTWVQMAVDQDARTARSGPVDSGTEYAVQIRAINLAGRPSDWSDSETITPTATQTLGAPTGLAATGGAGEAEVTFRMPTSPSLAYARLYSSTTNDFDSASQVGSDIVAGLGAVIELTDGGLSAGDIFYWARAFDGAGGQSALAGPATATIT